MPLPGSHRDKKQKEMLQEIVEPEVQTPEPQPEFLQEIKEPTHEEHLVEEKQPERNPRKKRFGII